MTVFISLAPGCIDNEVGPPVPRAPARAAPSRGGRVGLGAPLHFVVA